MDVQFDMDLSECSGEEYSGEEYSLKRKFAKSPSLSTISEKSRSSMSGGSPFSSKGSESIRLTPKSKKMRITRKLFSTADRDMEQGQSSKNFLVVTPPTKGQAPAFSAPSKQSGSDCNPVQESSSTNGRTPKKPLKDQIRLRKARKRAPGSEDSDTDTDDEVQRDEISNDFDKLFVCGIFNPIKPVLPTAKELETMYINNSSEDDTSPSTKKRSKMSEKKKKKVQSKLMLKKAKHSRKRILDSESDSDF